MKAPIEVRGVFHSPRASQRILGSPSSMPLQVCFQGGSETLMHIHTDEPTKALGPNPLPTSGQAASWSLFGSTERRQSHPLILHWAPDTSCHLLDMFTYVQGPRKHVHSSCPHNLLWAGHRKEVPVLPPQAPPPAPVCIPSSSDWWTLECWTQTPSLWYDS